MSKRKISNIAIIVAAGVGSRYGGSIPKQYLEIGGRKILSQVLEVFNNHKDIDASIVVINDNFLEMYEQAISGMDLLPYVIGGATRQESVYNALKQIESYSPKKVLIHDAARVFVDGNTISKLLSELDTHKASIVATKVKETVKYVIDSEIQKTVPRDNLYLAQTPQAFDYDTILKLHKKYSGNAFTDDASLCEEEGVKVSIVEGSALNFKITTKDDFEMAKKIIEE